MSSTIAAPGNFWRQKLQSRDTRRRNVLAISSIDKCGLMLLCLVGFVDYIPVGLRVKNWNQAPATKDESIELNQIYFDPQRSAHPCWKICVCVCGWLQSVLRVSADRLCACDCRLIVTTPRIFSIDHTGMCGLACVGLCGGENRENYFSFAVENLPRTASSDGCAIRTRLLPNPRILPSGLPANANHRIIKIISPSRSKTIKTIASSTLHVQWTHFRSKMFILIF